MCLCLCVYVFFCRIWKAFHTLVKCLWRKLSYTIFTLIIGYTFSCHNLSPHILNFNLCVRSVIYSLILLCGKLNSGKYCAAGQKKEKDLLFECSFYLIFEVVLVEPLVLVIVKKFPQPACLEFCLCAYIRSAQELHCVRFASRFLGVKLR